MYQFAGQRETPVVDVRGVVCIMFFLPGPRAAAFCYNCADLIVRYLGGDESLIDEVRRNRVTQEQLPGDHLLKIFGPSQQNVWSSFAMPMEKAKDGVVYTATSPDLDYVKIGFWTGTENALKSRYCTYSPDPVDIKTVSTADCRRLESCVHIALADFRLPSRGELYKKGSVDYFELIKQMQQQQDI